MATNDEKTPRHANVYPENKHLGAHKEPDRLPPYDPVDQTDADMVPPVIDQNDSTPKGIVVGSTILLGLAFGLGCWLWCDKEGLDSPQPRDVQSYAQAMNKSSDVGLPTPFALYGLDYTTVASPSTPDAARLTAAAQPAVESANKTVAVVPGTDADNQPVVYLFAYDSSTVPETAELTAIAEKATKNDLSLDVRAYTDEHGRAAYNKRLSERRAKAIADYLKAHGVPAANIQIHGMGPTHAYANDAQDRRAEIIVIK